MNVLITVFAVLGGFSLIWGFIAFIDWRVKKKITEESFIRLLAGQLYPWLVFDSNEAIVIDHGGTIFVESIDIQIENPSEPPKKIIISINQHMATAPLLTILDNEAANQTFTRGKGNSWEFKLDYFQIFDEVYTRRFRLEIIP